MTESSGIPSSIDYAQRRRVRAEERSRERWKHVPLVGILITLGIVALLVLVDVSTSWGRVHPGVAVAGVGIGGMRPESAASALRTSLPGKMDEPVVVVHGKKSWKVSAKDIGVDFDYDAMVEDAMAVGRDRNPLKALAGRMDAWFGGKPVPARPQADRKKLNVVLDRIARTTDVAPVDASVEIDGGDATVVPGKDGSGLLRERAEREILTAMLSADRRVEAPIGVLHVVISDDDAEAAAKVAEQMLSDSVKVTSSEKQWVFDTSDIADWIAFRRSDAATESPEGDGASSEQTGDSSVDATLVAYVSPKDLSKTLLPAVGAKVGHPAKDARFKTSNGTVTIIPSQEGVGPDVDALATELTADLTDPASDRSVELRLARAEPDITTEDARAMGVTERIARYTTTYESGNRARVNNIHLLGDALDGKLVAPGATFSFNGAVGERTAEKGYQEAGAIVEGKLVQQVGGGICQVGTTLFNTVFESGFSVVQRQNHSDYISHYPKGRDATVSWGGPDFKFRNDSDHWLLLSVSYTSSSVTIALYGTDPGYEVESTTGDWTNIKPYSTETIKDPTMSVGQKFVEEKGQDGRTIVVTRKVYKSGELIRTDTFKSVYKPKSEVVRVGTKPKSGSKTPSTAPTTR